VVLLAVPNVSEGRDPARIAALESAFSESATLLDRHSDPDHNRTVLTLCGDAGALLEALGAGAAATFEAIDLRRHEGRHPRIGALDICPLVWLVPADRDAAVAAATEIGERIGALGVPVFFYGSLASAPERVERAYFRQGGSKNLSQRMRSGELHPDRGSAEPHPSAGATLVTARPPLAAFNVELETDDIDVAREIAAALRESGGGLPGVRAIGLSLPGGRAQVSTNVHDPVAVPLALVVERIRELAAARGARPVEAELVGLAPEAALAGYPDDLPIRGFDPDRALIERRLAA
jgi:glutamate formiminotransferase